MTPKAVATRRGGYTHNIEIDGGRHRLVIDEPEEKGGFDEGPSPLRVVASALAACTAITVEMYANRKEWELGEVSAEVTYEDDGKGGAASFHVTLTIPEPLDAEQKDRILRVAAKCPVHRALAGETPITIAEQIETR